MNLVVSQVGIVVEGTELIFCGLIDVDVVAHVLSVLLQCALDAHGEREAYVSVDGGTFGEAPHRHLVEVGDQTVVTGNFDVDVVDT